MTSAGKWTAETLLDRQAIVDVLHRYAAAIDGKHWDLLADVFVPGADVDYSPLGGARAPYPEITKWLSTSLAPFATQHMLSNYVVEVDGDRATARSYLQATHGRTTDGVTTYHVFGGCYVDELIRVDADWRIAHRMLYPQWQMGDATGSS